MKAATTQIRYYSKSGARLYIPQSLIDDPGFPFKDGDIVRIEVTNPGLTLTRPEWWEIIDWNQMRDAYRQLPEEIRAQIQAKGAAPE
jgi:hypothetical protein